MLGPDSELVAALITKTALLWKLSTLYGYNKQ